jgi:hypothetical protein
VRAGNENAPKARPGETQLELVCTLLQLEYGEEVWQQVREQAGCKFAVFNTHHIYPDHLMTSLASACAEVTGEGATKDHFMQFFGRCFVRFFSNFGYRPSYLSQENHTPETPGHFLLIGQGIYEDHNHNSV